MIRPCSTQILWTRMIRRSVSNGLDSPTVVSGAGERVVPHRRRRAPIAAVTLALLLLPVAAGRLLGRHLRLSLSGGGRALGGALVRAAPVQDDRDGS